MKVSTTRWTEILRRISGQGFRGEALIDVPARLQPITELGSICQGVTAPPAGAPQSESWVFDSQVNQIGAAAAALVGGGALAPGVWHIRGFATLAGVIAVGAQAWNFGLLDLGPLATLFSLAAWRTVPGIQVAQTQLIDMPITLDRPWQFQHNVPATLAGDTLLARVSVQAIRLL